MRLRRLGRRATATVAVVASGVVLTGCGIEHINELAFRVDHRLHFVAPKSRSEVRNPVTIRWTMRDFRIAAAGSQPPGRDAGYFALFVDRAPIKPGDTLRSVGHGNPFCRQDPASCLTTSYLHNQGVYTTTGESLTLSDVTNIVGNRQSVQLHTFTIVLMDTGGHRIGESAWELDLQMHRIGSQ